MNAVTKRKLPKFKPLKRKTKQRLRILFYIASLGLAFLIQTSVFPLIPFLAASPNLLLILTFLVQKTKIGLAMRATEPVSYTHLTLPTTMLV